MKTYGSVTYNKRKNRFDITCEPHVAIRLKRVFSKIDAWQYGTQSISATPENCLDLCWFDERFKLSFSEEAATVLHDRADKYQEQISLVDRLLSGQVEIPSFILKLPPRKYQEIAATLWLTKGGLLLADDIGTGKTIVALCGWTDPRTLPALIVAPTHLPKQWEEQIHKFTDLKTHILRKGTPYDLTTFCGGKYPDVIISNYHKLAGWAETLVVGGRGGVNLINSVTFDEAHELRRRDSQKYRAAKHIANAVQFRLALTASPVVNYGGEIYNVLDVVCPDQLGTWAEFEREWCTYQQQKPKLKDPASFGTYALSTGIMMRRTRKDVNRELPEVTTIIQKVDADLRVLDEIKGQAIELAKLILSQAPQDFKGEKLRASGEFDMRMRQASGISKAPYVAEFVRLLIESSGESIVLFAWHREVYNILMEQLKDFNPVMYTGTESPIQKEQAKQDFIQGKSKIMLISLRAGMGLDGLQEVCHMAVFAELDWANIHTQCIDDKTEVLTERGFISRTQILAADRVAAFDINTGGVEWAPIDFITDRELQPGETMFSLQQPGMDLRITGGHRLVYRHTWGVGKKKLTPWKIQHAEELSKRGQSYHIPAAGFQSAQGVSLSNAEVAFLGWFVTDGGWGRAAGQVVIHQSESSPFLGDLQQCLDDSGFHYTTSRTPAGTGSQYNRNSDTLHFAIPKYGHKVKGYKKLQKGWARIEEYLDKNLSPLLQNMNDNQFSIFMKAVHMGDGNKQVGQTWIQRSYHIISGNRIFIERLQSLCVRRGWRANLSTRVDDDASISFALHTKQMTYRSVCGHAAKHRPVLTLCESQPHERVWCVSNKLGTLVVRRNGKVAIVGNCIGRIHRDGQEDPVVAYFLVSDHGSDPIMLDVLGVKVQQLSGLINPNGELVQTNELQEDYIRKLAEHFLTDHGIELPKESDTNTGNNSVLAESLIGENEGNSGGASPPKVSLENTNEQETTTQSNQERT